MKSPIDNEIALGLINSSHTSSLKMIYKAKEVPDSWLWVLFSMTASTLIAIFNVWIRYKQSPRPLDTNEERDADEEADDQNRSETPPWSGILLKKMIKRISIVIWCWTTLRTFILFGTTIKALATTNYELGNTASSTVFFASIFLSMPNYALPWIMNFLVGLVCLISLGSEKQLYGRGTIIGGHCPSRYIVDDRPDSIFDFLNHPPPIQGQNCTASNKAWAGKDWTTRRPDEFSITATTNEGWSLAFMIIFFPFVCLAIVVMMVRTKNPFYPARPRSIERTSPLSLKERLMETVEDSRPNTLKWYIILAYIPYVLYIIFMFFLVVPPLASDQIEGGLAVVVIDAGPDEAWWDYFILRPPTDTAGFIRLW